MQRRVSMSPATVARLMKHTPISSVSTIPAGTAPLARMRSTEPPAAAPVATPCDEVVEYDVPDATQVVVAYHNRDGKATWKIEAPRGANLDALHAQLLRWGRGWEALKRRRAFRVAE